MTPCSKNEICENINREILNVGDFILEGSYLKDWVYDLFEKCEKIFVIKLSYKVQKKRIIRRFLRRKFGIEKSNCRETIKSIRQLLNWSKDYAKNLDLFVNGATEKYGEKIVIVKDSDAILKQLLMN